MSTMRRKEHTGRARAYGIKLRNKIPSYIPALLRGALIRRSMLRKISSLQISFALRDAKFPPRGGNEMKALNTLYIARAIKLPSITIRLLICKNYIISVNKICRVTCSSTKLDRIIVRARVSVFIHVCIHTRVYTNEYDKCEGVGVRMYVHRNQIERLLAHRL